MIPIADWLIFAALLLMVGAYGVLTSKNGIKVLMSIEIMLNAANVTFVTFSAYAQELHGLANADATGQMFALVSIAAAAAEVAVALAILLVLYKRYGTIDVTKMKLLRW